MLKGLDYRAQTRLLRALSDTERLRTALRTAALLAIAGSFAAGLALAVYGPYGGSPAVGLVFFATPIVGLLAWLVPTSRPAVLAAAGGLVCYFTPEDITLWPAATALLYLSLSYDRRELPKAAIAAAVLGPIVSLVGYSHKESVAPFLAAALGVGLGLLERRLTRLEDETASLRRRTEASEAQNLWLEQRTALARELHDVVGHHVTAMVVQAEAGLVDEPRQALHAIGGLGRKALGELDALVVHLRDPEAAVTVSAPPRLSDIDELLAAPLRHQGVSVDVRLDDLAADGTELDEVAVLTLYRVAQEALTNVARHARATTAWVELVRTGRHVRLRVADDGIGPPVSPDRGAGLVGIEERVVAVGGMWSMSQRPGGGTLLDVYLPVPA